MGERVRLARVPKARDNRFKPAFLHITTKGAQAAFADEARCAPCPKADKVGAATHGLQTVVADLKAKIAKMFGDCAQDSLAVRTTLNDHDCVIHVPSVVLELERALAEVIQAVQRDIGCNLRQQVADRHTLWLRALREHHDQRDKALILDPSRVARLQHRAVDAVEELAHIDVQHPRIGRGLPHCALQPIGRLMGAAADAARK